MFGDLIYTDDTKKTRTPKSILGSIKPEFASHFDSKLGVWTHWSPDFVDIFSVPKEYRFSMFGQYAISPEEALDEFLDDMAPEMAKLRKAKLALMSHWDEVSTQKKKRFIKHFGKKFGGMNALFMGPSGGVMNLVMMLLLISEDEDMSDDDQNELTSMFVLALLMGMENKGPDDLQEAIKQMAKDSQAFQDAALYIQHGRSAGIPLSVLQSDLEEAMENNQVAKNRTHLSRF